MKQGASESWLGQLRGFEPYVQFTQYKCISH